jgi:hypothetical protein
VTVGELLEKLSKLPPEMVVATDGGSDNDVTADLTLYRVPSTVERTKFGHVYVYTRNLSLRLRDNESREDVALLAHWGQIADVEEL